MHMCTNDWEFVDSGGPRCLNGRVGVHQGMHNNIDVIHIESKSNYAPMSVLGTTVHRRAWDIVREGGKTLAVLNTEVHSGGQ